MSNYSNDRYYRALGVLVNNITFITEGWKFVYFNTLEQKYDRGIDDLGFYEIIKRVRRLIHENKFVNPEAKKKLYEYADKSVELNRKRNSKIHARVMGGGGEDYIREKYNNQVTMKTLDDSVFDEMEKLGDEMSALGKEIHEISYETEYYALIKLEEELVQQITKVKIC